MDNGNFTPLNGSLNQEDNEWKEFNFVFPDGVGEYAAELIEKYNLPGIVAEAVGLMNLEIPQGSVAISSEEANNIKTIIETGRTEEIMELEPAWQTLCVILYDKAKQLIEKAEHYKDFHDFFDKLKKSNNEQLEFVPEASRNIPLCCDVLRMIEKAKKINVFFAKARMLSLSFTYLSGGIVLLPVSDGYALKNLLEGKILFNCPNIMHISGTRLFRFTNDNKSWGLVDDTGRVVAPEKYLSISFWSPEGFY